MHELVRNTEQFVEKHAKKHPEDPDLARMYEVLAFSKQKELEAATLRQEMKPPEVEVQKFPRFSERERKVLEQDGTHIYLLPGRTLHSYYQGPLLFGLDAYDVLTPSDINLKGKKTEVAIYPKPDRFFVPESGGKSLDEQAKLVTKDATELKNRLSLEDIDEIIPDQAVTLLELALVHKEKSFLAQLFDFGILFGQDYDFRYGISRQHTTQYGRYSGFRIHAPISIGSYGHSLASIQGFGISILSFDNPWAVRLIVPRRV